MAYRGNIFEVYRQVIAFFINNFLLKKQIKTKRKTNRDKQIKIKETDKRDR